MRNANSLGNSFGGRVGLSSIGRAGAQIPRQLVIGVILILALFAFEMFNFDTTRYALQNLLGDVRFAGLAWATILAVAFCAIDFAGLARLFTPERGLEEPKEIWYLTGAWLLGATMNAVMTWWAVSTVLLSHELGNEVLSRDQLLTIVPIFVAILVWLTRILFIGAVTMAGERIIHQRNDAQRTVNRSSASASRSPENARGAVPTNGARPSGQAIDLASPPQSASTSRRIKQRPPRPAGYSTSASLQRSAHSSSRSRNVRRRV